MLQETQRNLKKNPKKLHSLKKHCIRGNFKARPQKATVRGMSEKTLEKYPHQE